MNDIITILISFVLGWIIGMTWAYLERFFKKKKQVEVLSTEDEMIKAYLEECMKDLRNYVKEWRRNGRS